MPRLASAPRTSPPKWSHDPNHGRMTGARPTATHKLLAAIPWAPRYAPPPQFAYVPHQLSYWLNNQTGDCHSADTEVLTEDGWEKWPDYDGKSLLATVNPSTLLMEYQAPLRVVRKKHDGPMAYGTHKGQDFAVTPRHRFLLRPYKVDTINRKYVPGSGRYGSYEFRTAENVPGRFLIPGAPSGFIGSRLDKVTIGSRQWDGTDFVRLLSLILSDGFVAGGDTNKDRISFCCFREDRLDMVRALAHKLGIEQQPSRPGVWIFRDAALANWLRSKCYTSPEQSAVSKCVPDLVKITSQDQVEEFLRFYGDQSFCNGRHFYTCSPSLADGLQELLMKTGKRANIIPREPRLGGINSRGVRIEGKHRTYELNVWEDSDVGMLGPKNKSASFEYDHYKGEVFCATVPNSTLITRRNGSVLISGNCVTAEEAFAKACNIPEIFIPDAEVGRWAKANGFYNGADLEEVIVAMAKDGFHVGNQAYNDGAHAGVDYSNETNLQSAISEGPVKIAIDASALPQDAGNKQGWVGLGGSQKYRNTDHCVGLAGYGPASYLFSQLGVQLPSSLQPTTPGYLLFTWSTIGFVDHSWLMSTCTEAWVRTPTTVGIPPLVAPDIDWSKL